MLTPVLADAYIHALDPVIVELPGSLAIRWYGLAYLAGFIVAWLMLRRMGRTGRIAMSPDRTSDFMMYVVVGVLVGGRMGYVFFYDQSLLWPPIGIIRVWDGGMAFHGGMIGVLVACLLFAARHRLGKLHVLDFTALACPPGLFFGRIANFINGELPGKPLPAARQADAAPWWSVRYPDELRDMAISRNKDLQQMTDLAQAAGIDPAAWQTRVADYGIVDDVPNESAQLVNHWIGRMVEQVRDGHDAVTAQLHHVLTAYYPSQLIQASAEGIVLFLILVIVWLRPRKPGVIGAWFLMSYGVLRIGTELFRQPDAGVALLLTPLYDLSRGQVLSALTVVAGIGMLIVVIRRDSLLMGGLLRSGPTGRS